MATTTALCSMLVAALTFQMVAIYLIEKSTATSPHGVLRSLEHFIMCVCIFSLIELVKTLSCRILSLRVHSEALFDSLQVRLPPTITCSSYAPTCPAGPRSMRWSCRTRSRRRRS